MSGWFRQIGLMARARTGASPAFFVWSLLAVLGLAAALLSFWLAAFVWLANRLGGVKAGAILGGICALIALMAALAALLARRREIARAKRELEERRRSILMDSGLIPIALQVGQAVGWRRAATLAVVGLFAMGLGRELFGERKDKPDDGDKD
jgi:Ca2+/Na+ antiporter